MWRRLFEVRAAAVSSALEVADWQCFEGAVRHYKLPEDEPWALLAYELLRRLVSTNRPIADCGFCTPDGAAEALDLLKAIDSDIFQRSLAHFEHSFRVSAL